MLLHIFSVISTVSPALVYGISCCIYKDNHCNDVGTLILALLRYGFDYFTWYQIISVCWVT